MKTTLYMAMSVNGIIARNNYSEDFLSDDVDWDAFSKLANRIGCFVVGRKTYDLLMTPGRYPMKDLNKKVKIIVVSKKSLKNSGNSYFAKSPQDAIKKAQTLGFKELLLAGGGKINSEFMARNLVQKLIINIDPVIVGKGIKLFEEKIFENRLKLLKINKLKNEIIQIHYGVK